MRPTHVQDVQGDDVGRGGAQQIGGLHPHLVGGEQGQVAGDVAGVLLLCPGAAVCTFRLRPVPPARRRTRRLQVRQSQVCSSGVFRVVCSGSAV